MKTREEILAYGLTFADTYVDMYSSSRWIFSPRDVH